MIVLRPNRKHLDVPLRSLPAAYANFALILSSRRAGTVPYAAETILSS